MLTRFDYSAAFLKWALRPPGWREEWACGVRVSSNSKLVAFISAIPATIEVLYYNYLAELLNLVIFLHELIVQIRSNSTK